MKPLYPSNISSSSVYLPETAPITGLMTVREPLASTIASTLASKPTETLNTESIFTKRKQIIDDMEEVADGRDLVNKHESNPFTENGYIRTIRSKEDTAFLDAQLISEQQNTILILGAVSTVTLNTLIGSLYLRK